MEQPFCLPDDNCQKRNPMIAAVRPLADPVHAPETDRERLAFLRVTCARSRCAARADLFEACGNLRGEPGRASEGIAMTLFRSLAGHGGLPRLRLFEPAAPDLSFDERWLLAAIAAAERDDADSLSFLLGRRLPVQSRRNICVLIKALARALSDAS